MSAGYPPRMTAPRRTHVLVSLMAVLLVSGCWWERTLSLTLLNDGPAPVTFEVVVENDPDAEPEFSAVVQPGDGAEVDVGRGGLGWRLLVDGAEATTSRDWPHDNPTIDLTIRVAPDGTIEVLDS